jgi:uncharacterized membrane protein SirB2
MTPELRDTILFFTGLVMTVIALIARMVRAFTNKDRQGMQAIKSASTFVGVIGILMMIGSQGYWRGVGYGIFLWVILFGCFFDD